LFSKLANNDVAHLQFLTAPIFLVVFTLISFTFILLLRAAFAKWACILCSWQDFLSNSSILDFHGD